MGAIRLNIGASDYSTGLNSYNDTPGDVEMKNFSLSRDDEFLVPMPGKQWSVSTLVFK